MVSELARLVAEQQQQQQQQAAAAGQAAAAEQEGVLGGVRCLFAFASHEEIGRFGSRVRYPCS